MIYNIIGDIHGRTCWKELVQDNAVNVFVGDYFSPYHEIDWEDQRQNFLDIITYKMEHPETILLVGNHDEDHWHLFRSGCSRHNYEHDNEIKQMFEEFADYFQVAFSIANQVLVTHAGVSYVWYEHYKNHILTNTAWNLNYNDEDTVESPYTHERVPVDHPMKYLDYATVDEAFDAFLNKYANKGITPPNELRDGAFVEWKDTLWRYNGESKKFEKYVVTPDEVAAFVNDLWKSGNYRAFDFMPNAMYDDYCGESVTHGPMWIRTGSLVSCNIFTFSPYAQVFGHTRSSNFGIWNNKQNKMFMIDCLEEKADSLIIEVSGDDCHLKTLTEYKQENVQQ